MGRRLFCLLIIIAQASIMASQDFKVIFDDEPLPERSNSKETEMSMMNMGDTMRILIIEKAREYIGVNYKWGAAEENAFDCSGYVQYVYAKFGFTLPHSSYEQYAKSRRLKESKAQPGDLVFFVTRGQRISHVGIYLGENTFIHAPSKGKQVCIESLDTEYFKKHLAGFGSIL